MALSLGKAQRLIFRPIMASPLMKWTWYPLKFELWFDTTLQNYWNWFLIWWGIILVKAPNHLLNRKSALVWYTISRQRVDLWLSLNSKLAPQFFEPRKLRLFLCYGANLSFALKVWHFELLNWHFFITKRT